MILSFEQWLIDQRNRVDPIGDLARLPRMQNFTPKPTRQKSNEHKNWVEVVIHATDPEYIAVFNAAWQEYLLAQKSASNGAL